MIFNLKMLLVTFFNPVAKYPTKTTWEGWRDGSLVRALAALAEEWILVHGTYISWPAIIVTPVLAGLTPSSGPRRHYTHVCIHTQPDICTSHTYQKVHRGGRTYFVSWWGGNGGRSLRLHNQILSEQAAELGKVGQIYAYISLCAELTFVTQHSCLES